jgi:ankyrin repeat protein
MIKYLHRLSKASGKDPISDVDISGYTNLHICSWHGTIEAANYVLSVYGSNTARRRALLRADRKGHLAPHIAAARGHIDILKEMRKLSIDLIELRDSNGCTPWLFAAQRGQIKTLRWLWSCCKNDTKSRCRLLLSKDRWDQNALHLAAMHDCPSVVKLISNELCRERDDMTMMNEEILNMPNVFGMNSLHVAAAKNRLAVLCALLKAGARVDEEDSGGSTALFYASERGHVGCVAELIRSGASRDKRSKHGLTPLDVACSERLDDMLPYLCPEAVLVGDDNGGGVK